MPDFTRVRAMLDDAYEALAELEAGCCVPTRSPRMAALRATLDQVGAGVDDVSADTARSVIDALEDAGGQIGSLQVACCAPARLPLYTRMLKDLTTAQRTITSGLNLEH
jgi:hypothetical protein